jgi:DNA helicase HerA-like ATPase
MRKLPTGTVTLLFTDIEPAVEQKIEQMVRLIRSKGVGVYFVSQNPLDIPDVILGQLGNRVQHALRAFTPRDQKAVSAAAQTFRQNPKLKVETVLTELGVGEALVSMLDEEGKPGIVDRARIVPPRSQVGAITPEQRKQIVQSSNIAGHYEKAIDRESAYEKLQARAGEKAESAGAPATATVLGAGIAVSAPMAALANGTLANALDFDEGSHLSTHILPAALAVAEHHGLSGKQTLDAFTLAYEASAR